MGKLKNFGKSYLKVSTFGLVDIDKKSKKRASEKSDTPEVEETSVEQDEPEVEQAPAEQDEPKSEGETNNEPVTACCGAPFSTKEFQSKSMCTLCFTDNAEVLEPGEPYCYLKLRNSYGEDISHGWTIGDVYRSKVHLPNGETDLLIKNTRLTHDVKPAECSFLGLKSKVVQLDDGDFFALDMYACGDALITMKDMGYDLNTKEGIKKAKNDKDKIIDHYIQLKKENLSLFTAQAEQKRSRKEEDEQRSEEYEKRQKQKEEELRNNIIQLLKDKDIKMPVSDINAHLKFKDIDKIKEKCEEMYQNDDISSAGNGRYFILTEEKKQPKKASAPKSEEVDLEKELNKLKDLLNKGLITEEQYDAKSNELLGL